MTLRLCVVCNYDLSRFKKDARFCSSKCQGTAYRQKHPSNKSPFSKIQRTYIGDIGELRVAIDLLGHGFDVFKAITGHNRCDLAAVKHHSAYRIEVRTAWINPRGEWKYSKPAADRYDILALVTYDGTIKYIPELPDILNGVDH